jgi:D-serine deaminase-like pyridoxal phosphate-dependent protein
MKITTPLLFLDEERCVRNIQKMADKAKRNNVVFRPHFKTHQSLEIGRWFKEVGVTKITVSSLEMATYFSSEWNDITVAFPVNILEIDTINQLASKIQLNLLIESLDTLDFLKNHLIHPVQFFIKVDIGYHRTGIAPENTDLIDNILTQAQGTKLNFLGFLGHAGHSYGCKTEEQIMKIHTDSIEILKNLKSNYQENYPELILSTGDTPTCSVAEDFTEVDEIRPGNFVFYDLTQNNISSNTIDEIAVAVACPVVAKHPERNELVVYGGGIHFAKDRFEHPIFGTTFGLPVQSSGTTWNAPMKNVYVKSLSQEHGIVSMEKDQIAHFELGDIVYILPVHSCMTGHAMKKYVSIKDGRIIERFN